MPFSPHAGSRALPGPTVTLWVTFKNTGTRPLGQGCRRLTERGPHVLENEQVLEEVSAHPVSFPHTGNPGQAALPDPGRGRGAPSTGPKLSSS